MVWPPIAITYIELRVTTYENLTHEYQLLSGNCEKQSPNNILQLLHTLDYRQQLHTIEANLLTSDGLLASTRHIVLSYSHPSSQSPHSDSLGGRPEHKHQWKTCPSTGLPPGRCCGRSWWSSEREAVSCPGTLSHVLDQLQGCPYFEESCISQRKMWEYKVRRIVTLDDNYHWQLVHVATWGNQQKRAICILWQNQMACFQHSTSCRLGGRSHVISSISSVLFCAFVSLPLWEVGECKEMSCSRFNKWSGI